LHRDTLARPSEVVEKVSRNKKNGVLKTQKRSQLAENLNRIFRKQRLVRPGERIGVAVSGGADSVALLRLLLELREEFGIVTAVVHFNHKLRGRNSEADERFVRKLAEKHGLEFFVACEDIAVRTKRERGNVEEVARRARYAFFEKLAKDEFLAKVAVAHTADDQAETVLAHILRGTGLSGLRGIHPQTGIVFRPLLGVRRAELRRYLKSQKQNWREDATNRDTKRTRARIRQKLLPILEKQFNAGVVEHLCQLAALAADDETFLETHISEWLKKWGQQTEQELAINLSALLQLPRALKTRALRNIVATTKTRGGQLSLEHVESLLELAEQQESGKKIQLPGGVEILRERETLRFRAIDDNPQSRSKKSSVNFAYPIDLEAGIARLRLVELSCLLHFREIDWPAERRETNATGALILDRSRLVWPLVVRNWQPGDAIHPLGHQKAHKVGRLLNEKSVSRWQKLQWPVLTSGGKLAWVRGLSPSVDFAVGPDTRRAVLIIEEPLS
jgi:tRNA(Ile)-lysidine synthase